MTLKYILRKLLIFLRLLYLSENGHTSTRAPCGIMCSPACLKVSALTCRDISIMGRREYMILGFTDIKDSWITGYFKMTPGYYHLLSAIPIVGENKKKTLCPVTHTQGRSRRNSDHPLPDWLLHVLFSFGISIINILKIILGWGLNTHSEVFISLSVVNCVTFGTLSNLLCKQGY